jgi:hypothetical protein
MTTTNSSEGVVVEQQQQHENGIARLAFTVVHECLFERQPPEIYEAIRVLQGVLQRYGDSRSSSGVGGGNREFGKHEPFSSSTTTTRRRWYLSPYVELRLRWTLAWILLEFFGGEEQQEVDDRHRQNILMLAAEHLQKAVSFIESIVGGLG